MTAHVKVVLWYKAHSVSAISKALTKNDWLSSDFGACCLRISQTHTL